ncbi:MAG: hypothetical protein C0482_29375 [Gordonia sp.]|jgi:hypothetical protein|uniref:hypothetical protein n=1 Tax=Williamsia sp. 1138 TaxID=1903117 RepID=UPI000A108940|nr:hypothetical protein [Williamsia sp. 1138]MBA4026471.1 hypothetical protein [Gordonia sp. (in: high G+C Gram-positive bacteria)]OZG29711.1 hypothetical protein BH683_007170 [Williamsia sp. 1138]
MTVRNNYAARATHYREQAQRAQDAGDPRQAGRLEELAERAETAHRMRPWLRAEDLRYDNDECCTECSEHLSEPHQPHCIYADLSYATA